MLIQSREIILQNPALCSVTCDEAQTRYADDVRENDPLFSEHATLRKNVPLMPSGSEAPAKNAKWVGDRR